jgi:hypothetical protein
MNEKNNNHHLSFKDLISESLIRDLILFIFIFLLIISQVWDNIFLLLFPSITFIFSLFFRILSTNKKRTEFTNSFIIYTPMGLEGKNANRLFFSSLFQLILIFWLGAESLYNAHLIEGYYPYFIGILIFWYTFVFFWIFIDLWKYSRIEIITDAFEGRDPFHIDSGISGDLKNIVSFLKLKNFKLISLISLSVFIILNILNIITILLRNIFSNGIRLVLPGSQLIILPYFFYGIIIIQPILTIFILISSFKMINTFNREKLNEIIKPLPKNIQIKIIENLKALNHKIKEQLKSE